MIPMTKTAIKIGPKDHGRPMSLEDFEFAEVQEGYIYELGRGVITVSDVPDFIHLAQVTDARDQLTTYKLANPGVIYAIPAGNECKLLVDELESERHPDLSIYKTPPPPKKNAWRKWTPEIVIEVVSPGSEERDYVEKSEEYEALGVREYWILDFDTQEMLVHYRHKGRWLVKSVLPPDLHRTRVLPGLEFSCETVFAAAQKIADARTGNSR